jgi:hypothetical protein
MFTAARFIACKRFRPGRSGFYCNFFLIAVPLHDDLIIRRKNSNIAGNRLAEAIYCFCTVKLENNSFLMYACCHYNK